VEGAEHLHGGHCKHDGHVARGMHLERAVKCIWDETLLISAKVAAIEIYIFTIQTITRGFHEAPLIV
jgi:hypothetical protein